MMKKLLENWNEYLTEKTFDDSKFPFPQAASAEEAEQIFTGGLKDGDPHDDVVKIKVSADIATCKNIYPTQREIILTNSLEVALRIQLGAMPLGGDIGAIISEDNYIMDGHHRWAGSWLAGGGEVELGGVQVGMPAKQLVAVLAAVGDKFHPGQRNSGRSTENIFNIGSEAVDKYMDFLTTKKGYSKWLTPDEAISACEILAGSVEGAKEVFSERLKEIQKNKPPAWAPAREEMPVIRASRGEHLKVGDVINKGQVDIYEPYALKEATELPKEIFTAFEDEIIKSKFWMEENDYDDLDDEDGAPPGTPATVALSLAMNKALKRAGMDDVVGIAHSSGDFGDGLWTSATIDVSEDGRPVFMILMNLWEDFEDFSISTEKMIKDVSAALRHELVHLAQVKAQAKAKGVDLETAFQQMMDDPGQVIDREDNPKYWKVFKPTGKYDKEGKEIIQKSGFKGTLATKDYLEKHIEVDAHAHQAAENLIDQYGEEKALDVISKDIDLDDPALPDEVKKYENFDVDKKSMNKFRSKIYTYIKKFTEEI
tara:strand:- start:354 stop:1973 length:1620 start_codon:yes stop_codon:yes gene_type:complete